MTEMTEFRIYEFTRDKGHLYASYFYDARLLRESAGETHLHMFSPLRSYEAMRPIIFPDPPECDDLFIESMGWSPHIVNLQTDDGCVLSRSNLPLTWFSLYPTDCETGFARFSTAGFYDRPLTSYMVTARRSQ